MIDSTPIPRGRRYRLLGVAILAVSPSLVAAVPAPQESAAPAIEDPYRVWLITAGPGHAVYERYGHNELRVLDTRTGRDVSYNWGMFDFEQVDFVPRFLRGEMLYRMVPVDGPTRIASYNAERRDAWAQELALTPAQKEELVRYAEWNALPENRDYLYQYFLDNCSTRVRDLLDHVLGGQLSRAFASRPAETTFRFETRKMTQVDVAAAAGIDLLLGSPTDDPISVWEQMFLPSVLRETLRGVSITLADGTDRPLVATETFFGIDGAPQEPETRPRWWPVYLLIGLSVAGLLLLQEGPRAAPGAVRIALTAFASVWSVVTGLAGTLLVLLLFTDHTFAHANHNLMLFPPLLLAMVVLWPMSLHAGRAARLASLCAWAIAAFSGIPLVMAALPGPGQGNEGFLALAVPAHLAAALVLHRRARRAGST